MTRKAAFLYLMGRDESEMLALAARHGPDAHLQGELIADPRPGALET